MACNCGGNSNGSLNIVNQVGDAASSFDAVSISIQSEVQTVPGGFALTGFLDVEKLLNITCDSKTSTFFLEKKLPYQILFMQVCPSPTPPPPGECTCGFDTTAPVVATNNVKFDDQTGTDSALLTLQGFVCADNPTSNTLSFTAVSENHNLSLTASGTNITAVCSSPGQPCTVTVTGTGLVTLDGTNITPNQFTLTITNTPGTAHYTMVIDSGATPIFNSQGEVSAPNTQLITFCPS